MLGAIGIPVTSYGSVSAWIPYGDEEHDTTAPATTETTLVDTGTGHRGRLNDITCEIDQSDSASEDFEIRVYIDGESTPSINVSYTTFFRMYGNNSQTGNSIFGTGNRQTTSPNKYSVYLDLRALGCPSYFKDRLKVTAYNPSSDPGDYDWIVLWDEASS